GCRSCATLEVARHSRWEAGGCVPSRVGQDYVGAVWDVASCYGPQKSIGDHPTNSRTILERAGGAVDGGHGGVQSRVGEGGARRGFLGVGRVDLYRRVASQRVARRALS